MEREKIELYKRNINAFYAKRKRMPSYSEMLGIFGLKSKNAVFKRITRLVREGFLEKDSTGKILPGNSHKALRLLGFVQAGWPSPAEEELQDVMSLDEYLVSNPQATYLLKVEGDSMIGAGIHPGDLALVQKNLTPRTGDIVVARIDGEWTLKYLEKKPKGVILRSANKKYPPIIPRSELIIAGVVVANVRKYK